jgi:hypothetical protein
MIAKIKIGIYITLYAACIGIIIFLLSSCMSAPERKNYSENDCFIALDCMYRIKSDKDKSICMPLIESCRDALKESRGISRLKFCRDYKPAGMTENECRLWLNQK